ncbi:MAG: hypothetical protein HYS53_03490 [Candidatus Aenigmarchaeota archaeon]|nr:hypothetical protein [Candidatus Aenigmarchaeota archaeon]
MPRLGFLRPLNFFFLIILAASGYFVSAGSLGVTGTLVKVTLSILFLTLAANVFSEFYSGKIYRMIKSFYPRPGGKGVSHSVIVSAIFLLSGLVLAYSVSIYTASLYLLAAFLLSVYLSYLKNVRFIRSIFISAAASVAVVLGADAAGPSSAAYFMAVLLFFSNASGDMVKSITEGMKDRATFLVNLLKNFSSYVKFDENRTRKTAAASLAVFIILSPVPYAMGLVPLTYLAIITLSSLIAFVALFNLIKDGKNVAVLSKTDELIKINMLLAIIAFLAGVPV